MPDPADEGPIEALLSDLTAALSAVPGLVAVVLGGSRARGAHAPGSDVDLGLCYRAARPPDLAALEAVARAFDDAHRPGLLTAPGGWGPWINGGGWLTVREVPVDFLYRDLDRVTEVIDECLLGRVTAAYQPGHPHAFSSAIYLGEIALCRPLWDPDGAVAALKARVLPYPPALRAGVLRTYAWEMAFSLRIAEKGAARGDVAYVAGCAFRAVACLLQCLFALNGVYWLNEKGALALAEAFPRRPERLAERVHAIFASLRAEPAALRGALAGLAALVEEAGRLLPERA